MRYPLRTLLILLAIEPPVLAGAWFALDLSSARLVSGPILSELAALTYVGLVVAAVVATWTRDQRTAAMQHSDDG